MKLKDYIIENSCDFGGVNLGRIKRSAWDKIKDLEFEVEEKGEKEK